MRKQIVHNAHVVADLTARGAVFVNELDEIPDPPPAGAVPPMPLAEKDT